MRHARDSRLAGARPNLQNYFGWLAPAHATPSDAQVMADLSIAAQTVAASLCALDTTTAGAVAIDSECPALDVAADAENLSGFAIMYAGIARLRHRAARTLAGLERRRGASATRVCGGLSGSFAISTTPRPVGVSPTALSMWHAVIIRARIIRARRNRRPAGSCLLW